MGNGYAEDNAPKAKHQTSHDSDLKSGSTSVGSASQPAVPDTVLTKWLVNYSSVLGRRKEPSRSEGDQLIVDELRVQPDAGDAVVLHGGNVARAGRVHLGDANVARGPGSVAALIRYGQRASFRVQVSLDSKPTAKEQQQLNKLSALATRRALEEGATEGDYAAIEAKLEQEFALQFEGKAVHVTIIPDKAKQQGVVAREAGYEANANSRFEVDIDPEDVNEHTNTATHSEGGEQGEVQSHSEGSRTSTDTTTQTKQTQAKEYETTFISTLNEKVTHAFKEIQQDVVAHADEHGGTHVKEIGWKAGIGQAKGDDKKDADPSAKGDGLLAKAWKAVGGGTKWFLKTVKDKVLKRIPLLNEGLDLLGGLWDAVSGRAYIERGSIGTDTTTDSHTDTSTTTSGTEITDLSEIGHTLSTQIVTNHKDELETLIAKKFGTEVTTGDKKDDSKKKTVNNSYTSSSTVYEARMPKITIKKLG